MDTSVESDCLCKIYRRGKPGLIGLTFRVAPGEIFGLLGPAGAGKTTALKLIAGLLKPTAGRLRIEGHDSVAERAAARSQVWALLDMGTVKPARRQVIVVDEPALGLTEPGWERNACELRELAHAGGKTIILATRRRDVACLICDRVAVLQDGWCLDERPAASLAAVPVGEWWEIRVRGHLTGRWGAWFAGLSLAAAGDGTCLLSGWLADQAALHGVLARVRDMGLPLVSARCRGALNAPEDFGGGATS